MPHSKSPCPVIRLRSCRQHNLRDLDLEIPHGKLTVVTGPSGSGKSSLAFHTLYAEGQRRYVETFSPYVRQFFDRMDKPDVDEVEGIPPAIAIEQKNHIRTTRSTVGTLTEVNDYLKLLYPRLAQAYDPETGELITPDSAETAADWALAQMNGEVVLVTFCVDVPENVNAAEFFAFLNEQGYLRVVAHSGILRTDEEPPMDLLKGLSWVLVIQDRLKVGARERPRLLEALEAALQLGKGRASLHREDGGLKREFVSAWTNPRTGFTLQAPTPALFSFNSPLGACPKCRGFGRVIGIDMGKTVPDPFLSIADGAIRPFQGERGEECQRDLLRCCAERGIDIHRPWEELSEDDRDWIYYGNSKKDDLTMEELDALWQAGDWYGVKGFFDWLETKAYKMHVRVFLSRYRSYTTCSTCRGRRLQPQALCFRIEGKTLPDLWRMPVADLLPFVAELIKRHGKSSKAQDPTLKLVLQEVHSRLYYLNQVGLGYLTLDRATRTLSGGEIERVNLTACLGASLTGTLFVLDEPTVGLHARDIEQLVAVMHRLRDLGNTLVVVEHEQAVMEAADHLIDLGPGAGRHGGNVMYAGPASAAAFRKANAKIGQGTLPWLDGRESIAIPKEPRKPGNERLLIRGATRHNLSKLDIDVPLGLLVCLTGVSGSGKSTLAHDVIYQNLGRKLGQNPEGEAAPIRSLEGSELLDGVDLVDQSAVARTPRSTPALFLGAFDAIRQLFCEEPQAVAAGLKPGYFSFNSGEGRCDRCAGTGSEKVEMQFLSDLYVTCPDCEGRRYKPSTLEYSYAGLSIADVLGLSVDEALEHFAAGLTTSKKHQRWMGQIHSALQPLVEVGLGYLLLGQPLNTLSGGESQRLKLCKLLRENPGSKSKRLLIMDEPTTGLHFRDIERLLGVFHRLVDAGNSLLVIEHNVEVIKSADWILDLGPEAGDRGGQLVGQGNPQQISRLKSPTGHLLKDVLGKSGRRPRSKPAKSLRASNAIELRGARHHNLKNLSLDIVREKLVVISGLSGSGKSTLAFDILFAEGQRRFLDSMSTYARQFAEQLEKPELDQLIGLPPTVAIEQRVSQGGGKSTVATVTEVWNFARLLYAKLGIMHCPDCGVPVSKQSLAAIENAIRKAAAKGEVSLLAPVIRGRKGYHSEVAEWALKQGFERLLVDGEWVDGASFTRLARYQEHDIDVEVARFKSARSKGMSALMQRALQIGRGVVRLRANDKGMQLLSTQSSCPSCKASYDDLDPRLFSFNSPHGWCPQCRGHGVVARRGRRLDTSRFDSVMEAELDAERAMDRMDQQELVECDVCKGARLNAMACAVQLAGYGIADLAAMPIAEASAHFAGLDFDNQRQRLIARDILPEIRQRLAFLEQVGLGYLQLNRSGNTLSGGESQRIRLAAQLGSNLRGVLYVLDEPTIGLHPRDNRALLATLAALRDHGNSLIIVEHDEDTIAAADHLIDLGPGAGRFGGEVVYEGPPISAHEGPRKASKSVWARAVEHSPTIKAMLNPMTHPMRGERRAVGRNHAMLQLVGCTANNLKRIEVKFPLARLTVITGISGSGKSTLLHECIAPAVRSKRTTRKPFKSAIGFEAIKACYEVDQAPIGKTSRSCPATYVKVFDHIRALFAQLPDARMRGYDASRFSFNTEGGRCPECKGNGRIKLEMDFLPAAWVHCQACNGLRYNSATLEARFKSRNIGEVLAMTIDEAADFFDSQPRIAVPLRLMADTGLGYLQLGQPSPTLSGGEAQRIKLVAELIKGRGTKAGLRTAAIKKRNLYLIEEPTVGLHHEDIRRLIEILHRLVDEGHTVVVIEHHMDVAAEADWILDLGPEAGEGGGRLVAWGVPEKVARSKRSNTASFLAEALLVQKIGCR